MNASNPLPLERRSMTASPSEAERSLLYADLIGLVAVGAGTSRKAHAEGRPNNPGTHR
jgi:hypothetical protein